MDSLLSKEVLWSKENVLSEILVALSPSDSLLARMTRFVDYFFAHEKEKDRDTLSREELRFVFEKCTAAINQPGAFSVSRQRKLHSSRKLKEETVIGEGERVHGSPAGTRGWISGWLTTQAHNACVDLELDTPMFVTKMMIFAVNVKASPRSMELYAKDASNTWTLVRSFEFRDRTYEGSHGQEDYSKKEMFMILGDRSNQEEMLDSDWEAHPLAGPGEAEGKCDFYMTSKYWRWKILDAHGAHYVGINDFSLYGREAVFPAPEKVQAEPHSTGAKITWSFPNKEYIDHFEIIAYPGGFGFHANGGFFESCEGNKSEYLFASLSPGVHYQFQVIAVREDSKEGTPSEVTEKIKVSNWKPEILDCSLDLVDQESDNTQPELISNTTNYSETMLPSITQEKDLLETEVHYSDVNEAFSSMLRGDFKAVESLLNSNKVVLYISGSLEDTIVERRYISDYVIPKLTLWCSANGYDFSGIDLRWGLQSELSDDHRTLLIHTKELERAYKNSSLTIFCFISGEKYGSVMLPPILSVHDRNVVYNKMKPSIRWILDASYEADDNGQPPVYVLKNVQKIISSGKSFKDIGSSIGVGSLLKEIMVASSKNKDISDELKSWQPSLTIVEVNLALQETSKSTRNKFICCMRTLKGLYQAMESEKDLPIQNQKARLMGCDNFTQRRIITDLRRTLSNNPLVENNCYVFDWSTDGLDINREDASMRHLCCNLYSRIKQIIVDEFSNRRLFQDLEQEFIHHAAFVQKRSKSFVGREELIFNVMVTINSSKSKITVLHGVSGAGKTSVMCSVAARWRLYLPENTVVLVRLCGTSPRSSSAKGVLKSLCSQLHHVMSIELDIPESFDELVQCFESLLLETSKIRPVAIFIDSLDQLNDESNGRSQPWKWIPKRLPDQVYLVVSTLPNPEYGILQTLQEIGPYQVEVPLLPSFEGKTLLAEWLLSCKRTLTVEQRLLVEDSLEQDGGGISMLHLRLIFDRVSKWSSDHIPLPLPSTVQGMIEMTYKQLEREHGRKLVQGFLTLLGSSQDGLSAENIADILSADEESLGGKHVPDSILEFYSPPIRRVPPYLIARLICDLEDYLVERGANGIKVLGLYHRQFIEVSQTLYLETIDEKQRACRMLFEYFSGESANKFIEREISSQPYWFFLDTDKRVPNRQKLVELPQALIQCENYEEFAYTIMNFEYIEAKYSAGGSYATSLISEYGLAMNKLQDEELLYHVTSFYRFITTWSHVLRRNPTCLTTLALNYVPNSVVTQQMKIKWEKRLGMEDRGWIKWENAPKTLDPCIATNVLSRAQCLTCVRYSPDGDNYIVTGNAFCVLCDLQTSQVCCEFRGHSFWVRSACFSPDGKYILTVSNDKTGKVWNSKSGETCAVLAGHLSWVLDCGWSVHEDLVFTASDDGTARLWNPYFGSLVGIFWDHGSSIKCGKFSPCGEFVITGDADGKIIKWKTKDQHNEASTEFDKAVNCLDWNEKTNLISAALYSGKLIILNSELETLNVFTNLVYSVNTCVFHPDGDEIMIAGAQRVGIVLNIKTGESQGQLVGHNNQITSSDWKQTSDGSSLLLTASEDQTVKTWQRRDVIPGDVFETFAQDSWKPNSAFGLAFTKTGALYGLDNGLNIFQCTSPVLCPNPPLPILAKTSTGPNMGDKTSSNLAPDGLTWAICSYCGVSSTMRHSDGEKLKDFSLDVAHNCLRWDPSGKPRFMATGHGVGCRVWNSESGSIDCDLDINGWSWDASWSRNGQFLVVSNDKNTALFNMWQSYTTGDRIGTCFEGKQSMRCALNEDGSRLGIVAKTGGGYNSTATSGFLYDLSDLGSSGEDPIELTGDFTNAETMIFSSDSKFLFVNFKNLAFGTSPSICAYDSQSGDPVAWFVSPMNVNFTRLAVPYVPCSKLVVSDASGKLYLFNVEET
eukprot:g4757.t1